MDEDERIRWLPISRIAYHEHCARQRTSPTDEDNAVRERAEALELFSGPYLMPGTKR
jgi:hypothetical protein